MKGIFSIIRTRNMYSEKFIFSEQLFFMLDNVKDLDRLQIRNRLAQFSVSVYDNEDTEQMRRILTKVILEEILKCDVQNRDCYTRMLQKVLDETYYGADINEQYLCCIPGCRYRCGKHKQYIVHIKNCHPRLKTIVCNFRKSCMVRFDKFDDFMEHIKVSHMKSSVKGHIHSGVDVSLGISCKCNRITCGEQRFENIDRLMKHWNTFHGSESRDCIFEDCASTFTNGSTSRSHFRLQHKEKNLLTLKSRHLITGAGQSCIGGSVEEKSVVAEPDISDFNDLQFDSNVYTETDIQAIENNECCIENDSDDYYLRYYADFLNRLTNFKFIPMNTVQEIAEEYLSNTKQSLEELDKRLRSSLSKISTLTAADVDKVVTEVVWQDRFLLAQEELNTEYKRTKYVQENMGYVSPKEIILNPEDVRKGRKKDVYHYVPITESIRSLVSDHSFNKMMALKTREKIDDRKIRDIKDGSWFKSNTYFRNNPDAFSLILYSDAVELKNPLGAARGRYKVTQVFFTMGEIEKSQRSQIDRLQLVMEKLLKTYSLEVIYNVLVNDLKRLEVGVKMNVMSVGRDIKCGVICYSADNLEVRNQVLITNLSLHLRFPKIMVKPVSPHFKDRE